MDSGNQYISQNADGTTTTQGIVVARIPKQVEDGVLAQYFSKYGKVKRYRLIRSRFTGGTVGTAIISLQFRSNFDDFLLKKHYIFGSLLKVSPVMKRTLKEEGETTYTVVVIKHIPVRLESNEVLKFAQSIGLVQFLLLLRAPGTLNNRGYTTVLYDTASAFSLPEQDIYIDGKAIKFMLIEMSANEFRSQIIEKADSDSFIYNETTGFLRELTTPSTKQNLQSTDSATEINLQTYIDKRLELLKGRHRPPFITCATRPLEFVPNFRMRKSHEFGYRKRKMMPVVRFSWKIQFNQFCTRMRYLNAFSLFKEMGVDTARHPDNTLNRRRLERSKIKEIKLLSNYLDEINTFQREKSKGKRKKHKGRR